MSCASKNINNKFPRRLNGIGVHRRDEMMNPGFMDSVGTKLAQEEAKVVKSCQTIDLSEDYEMDKIVRPKQVIYWPNLVSTGRSIISIYTMSYDFYMAVENKGI
jgi:hypothetical protein